MHSCTKCTDSEYPCKWCIKHHICTNHATSSEACEDDIMVTGRQVTNCLYLIGVYNDHSDDNNDETNVYSAINL